MHLKLKIGFLPAALLIMLVAISFFFFATITVINQAFSKVETDNAKQDTARAVDALTNQIDNLKFKATDWASWDDTYAFVLNHNPAYIKSNLVSGALNNLGIHYMLFYNVQQQLVESKAVDPVTGQDSTIPQALLGAFMPGSKLLATGITSESKGFIALPGEQTVKFVALPILTSDSTGPYHGTLVFATVITSDDVNLISQVTHLKTAFYRLDDKSRPADVTALIGQPTTTKTAVATPSDNTIVGYQTVNDVYGHPALVARVQSPREIHQTATGAIRKFMFISVLLLVLSTVVVVIFMMLLRSRDRTIALKNEFFSIANHELRTPLTVIRNYAQLMKFKFSNTIKDPSFDHMADSIDQAGSQLIGVVNVYLDAARLESGKIPWEPKAFALAGLVTNLEPQLKATAHQKNLHVEIQVPADLPPVLADQERVRQVILNLFGNAMKFTETGGITIKAEPDQGKMHVYVTDTGRGMDEVTSRQLFQRFKQVQAKDALRGSGLGLFISKKIVEQMGGSIQVDSSALGIGTTIGFSLPLATPAGSAQPTPPSAPASNPPAAAA
ncbi:MAG TPA: CHASE4 domain-containing protein [Candidatus Saccharimonadia bacterium]|jgi:signal transduction histidine kinase